jgi:anti-sigma-K factor RskA
VAEHTFGGLTCSDVREMAGSYVLGALTSAEGDAVRGHLADCPEVHAELAELHSVIPALFQAVDPIAPPPGLRDRIRAAAAADLDVRAAAPPRPTAPTVAPPRETREAGRGWDLGTLFGRPIWAPVGAAALVLAIALGAWNVQLGSQLASLEAYRNGVVEVLDAAAKPGAQLAVLADPRAAGGPSGLAAVGRDGGVAIVMRNLAPTSGSQVYEAWLIGADQVPVAIGGFQVGGSGSAAFTTAHTAVGEGVVVALTLEPREGATKPTLPILALGTARATQSS